MALRPIFAATHPRACSTAFERVFMTRRDILESVHEPFGDAFYYGPEFLSDRFRDDAATRERSGFADKTYKDILAEVMDAGKEGKRIFIKDMAYYLMRADGEPTKTAPSLGEEEAGNPTVLPLEVLKQFQFTFLIRHPRRAIPSYYRCTTGIDFKPEMLEWNDADKNHARDAFEKWNGFHNDAIKSSALKPRTHAQTSTTESEDKEWTTKWGPEAQKLIRKTVEDNVARYEYLKQFALLV
ncbi:hypothetical protein ACJZ2D_015052 [Fusarium nematophilum]